MSFPEKPASALYKIVTAGDRFDLETHVSALLAAGWQCVGGCSFTQILTASSQWGVTSHELWVQAMQTGPSA